MMPDETLLDVRALKKYFPIRRGLFGKVSGHVKAVDGVSFSLQRGRTLGLVGESGSGKTTVGRTLLGLTPPSAGSVHFQGLPIHTLDRAALKRLRPRMQLVFQDPFGSLNPRLRVGDAIGEALLEHRLATPDTVRERVLETMAICGLAPSHYTRYPHEFSGGQRQRIGIARALVLRPDLIVADEPVSALDVSIQAQIINLFSDLQEQQGVTVLFISHDLAVVEHLCDTIAVMYLGEIVEMADRDALFDHPMHPYTQALLSAIPPADPDARTRRIVLQGEIPSPAHPPSGCRFHTRCPRAHASCAVLEPVARDVGAGHIVACHRVGD
jgi:peptide/nickel transport system ATP-binding protein